MQVCDLKLLKIGDEFGYQLPCAITTKNNQLLQGFDATTLKKEIFVVEEYSVRTGGWAVAGSFGVDLVQSAVAW